jgi:hypothetical protein
MIPEGNQVRLAPVVAEIAQCEDGRNEYMAIAIMSYEVEERVTAFLWKGPLGPAKFAKYTGTQGSSLRVACGTQVACSVQNVTGSPHVQRHQSAVVLRTIVVSRGINQRRLDQLIR